MSITDAPLFTPPAECGGKKKLLCRVWLVMNVFKDLQEQLRGRRIHIMATVGTLRVGNANVRAVRSVSKH